MIRTSPVTIRSKIKAGVEQFRSLVPTDSYAANLTFRETLYSIMADDPSKSAEVMAFIREDPTLWFDCFLFTYNPRCQPSRIPFVLRPKQRQVVHDIYDAINHGGTIVVDKSRDEGATEICTKLLTLCWLTKPHFFALVASHKEELVDKGNEWINGKLVGSFRTLMYKVMEPLLYIPTNWVPEIKKTHLMLQNITGEATIQGESTNPDLGVGGRYSVVFVDELCRVEPALADLIIQNLPDTTGCLIYNSSLGQWGESHPYVSLLRRIDKGLIKGRIVTLDWTENPEKARGLYCSPRHGVIKLLDNAYWSSRMPKRLWNVIKDCEVDLSKAPREFIELYDWVADGGDGTFGRPRSLWLDEEERRRNNRVDLAYNVLRIPLGGTNQFFDTGLVEQCKHHTTPPQRYLVVDVTVDHNTVKATVTEFDRVPPEIGVMRLWTTLPIEGRIIFGIDVARGTGYSNSVVVLYNRTTHEIIGQFSHPRMGPDHLAEYCVALARYIHDEQQKAGIVAHWPLLIWENIGPGQIFAARLRELRYSNVWRRQTRYALEGQHVDAGFWTSGGESGTKQMVLTGLELALREGLRDKPVRQWVRIYDDQIIDELPLFRWKGRNVEAVEVDDGSTKAAHGDRVMATALAVYAAGGNAWQHETDQPSIVERWIEHCRTRDLGARSEGKFLSIRDL